MSEVDFLDEDTVISTQKYFLLSYLLNEGENSVPMIKVRGSFSDIESCQKRVKKLQAVDSYFNIFICEVGKWGGLYRDEDVTKINDLYIEYQDNTLNDLMKSYKENRDNGTVQFEERKNEMKARAIQEGTREGQMHLADKPEEPFVIAARIKTLQETVDVYRKNIVEIEKKIFETLARKSVEQDKYDSFSESEKCKSILTVL